MLDGSTQQKTFDLLREFSLAIHRRRDLNKEFEAVIGKVKGTNTVSEITEQVKRFGTTEKCKERKFVEEGSNVLLQIFQQLNNIAIPPDFNELFVKYDPLELARIFSVPTTFENCIAVVLYIPF
jgi:hypothetical protein